MSAGERTRRHGRLRPRERRPGDGRGFIRGVMGRVAAPESLPPGGSRGGGGGCGDAVIGDGAPALGSHAPAELARLHSTTRGNFRPAIPPPRPGKRPRTSVLDRATSKGGEARALRPGKRSARRRRRRRPKRRRRGRGRRAPSKDGSSRRVCSRSTPNCERRRRAREGWRRAPRDASRNETPRSEPRNDAPRRGRRRRKRAKKELFSRRGRKRRNETRRCVDDARVWGRRRRSWM